MNPFELDIPQQFTTDRLLIRCAQPGEGPAANAAIRDSIEQLRPWMPWAQTLPAVSDTEEHARRAHARFLAREDLTYRAWLKDSQTFVVGSGLHRINWVVPKFEIGYWVRSTHSGQGYVHEVVQALTKLAFEKFHAQRVEIRCDDRNLKSIRVAERAGFQLEGILRNDSRGAGGSLRSTRVYAKIAPLPQ
jgi:RimJ/RimL family protein N-acetyltransferase